MKEKLIYLLKYIKTFILLIIIFNIGLYLACSFNSKLIKKNVIQSQKMLEKEGMFYNVSDLFNIRSDNSADALMINECYSVDSDEPYVSYMKTRKNYRKNAKLYQYQETVGELSTYVEEFNDESEMYYNTISELGNFLEGKIHSYINYGRYWHGYLILLRPLLMLFNIMQLRHILFFIFCLLFTYLIYLLYKEFGLNIAIIFGLSLICSGYFSASYILEVAPAFLIMMISSIILVKNINKIKDFYLFIFIIGSITNYFDYLTVPLITLGFPCTIYILKLLKEEKDWKYCVKFLIKSSLVWVTSYAITWILKWVQYDLTINDGNSMLKIGFGQAMFRMQRVNEALGIDISYISVIVNIIGKSLIYTILTILIIMILNKFKPLIKKNNKKYIPFLIISLYPIIWFVALANHTIMHNYFTYRNSLLFMLGILLTINELLFSKNKNIEEKNNNKEK